MTSEEIKAYEISGTEREDPRLEKDFVTEIERNIMLKEIAYQLAVANELNQAYMKVRILSGKIEC